MYLAPDELLEIGFRSVGKNIQISRKCSFYKISGYIGDNVRIDDFCILKGKVNIGSHVHVAAYCMISGAFAPIEIDSFVAIAARASIYSGSDDYASEMLGGAFLPDKYVTVITGPVTIGAGTLVGAHCVILPNVRVGLGASIGSGCVIANDVPDGGMMRGPRAVLLDRRRDVGKIKAMIDEMEWAA